MDIYKEIEESIAFKTCICSKEIVTKNFKTEINKNQIVQMDAVQIKEVREDIHCIELSYYLINKEGLISTSIYFGGNIVELKQFISLLFEEVKFKK